MDKPNVILINCDDLGYGDLGCTGSTVHQTPNLDRMAHEGIRFTNFYMASPVCSASRAAMLTGSYPQRVGITSVLFPGSAIGLHPQEMTIGRALKNEGYNTMIVGKWHCGDQPDFLPTRHGFDDYFGLPYSNDMGRYKGCQNKVPPLPLMAGEEVLQQQPDQCGITERYLEESIRFIRRRREAPFFLYLAHMYVHLPLYVPERFLRESQNGRYGGAISCIDWVAGVLFEELKQCGIDEDTIVIFTSDNGSRCDFGKSNGYLRGTKFTCWEGGQRVPCIIRWPKRIPGGRVCDAITTSMDFLPTLAGIAGGKGEFPHPIDGKDMSPLLFSQKKAATTHEHFIYYNECDLWAVRKGKWKLHFYTREISSRDVRTVKELYDLEVDPSESKNLYDEFPDVVAELNALAHAYRYDLGDEKSNTPRGRNCRAPGAVSNPQTLTVYHQDYPYYIAEYDLAERG